MHGIKWYPAAWGQALATVLGVVVAFDFLSQTAASYVATAGVAVIGLITAALSRPWDVPLISAALTSALTAFTAFGLKWSDHQIAIVVTAVMWIAGYLIHDRVSPVAGSPYALSGQPTVGGVVVSATAAEAAGAQPRVVP